jgi:hypothetical protein
MRARKRVIGTRCSVRAVPAVFVEQAPDRRTEFVRRFLVAGGLKRRCGTFGFRGFDRSGFRAGIALLQQRQQVAARHRRAIANLYFAEGPRGRCRHLEHDLVGFQVDQVLIAGNGFARFLVPADEGCVGY